MPKIKKAQKGIRATPDSTSYFDKLIKKQSDSSTRMALEKNPFGKDVNKRMIENVGNLTRQQFKGKKYFDKNGNFIGAPGTKKESGGKVNKAKAGKKVIKAQSKKK
jgi:hypothetical protein